jgi:hypothetical protein
MTALPHAPDVFWSGRFAQGVQDLAEGGGAARRQVTGQAARAAKNLWKASR